MGPLDENRPFWTGGRWTAVWLGFAVISAATLAYFVAVYVPHERAGAIDVWRGRLSAMADDRKAAITTWVDERRADAKVLSEYPTVALLIDAGHGASVPLAAQEAPRIHLRGILDSARAVYGYDGVYVFDASGQAAAISTGSSPLGAGCIRDSELVLRSGVAHVDFHAREDGSPMLAIVAPVTVSGRVIGTVVLAMDPSRWLYPLLRSEPTHTSTAESLLARQSGNQIEFLSPLRHNPAPPLTFRVPFETSRLAAVSAVRGEEVFAQYVDYRGVPALSVTRRIPNTGWGLVVKVDEDEALAGFRRSVRQGAFAIAGLLLAVAGLGFGANRAMAGRHRRELGESEARFALLRDHANDAILFAGRDGVILDVNRRAEQLYVRRREDLLGLPLDELRAPEERAALRDRLDALARDEQLVFEAVHRRPDGTRFPVEVSIRVMQLGEQEVFLSIVRDITERKRAEEALRESEDRFRYVFEHSILGMSLTRPAGEVQVNRAFAEMLGYSLAEMTGKKWQEITHPDDVADTERLIDSVVSGEREFARFTKRYIHKNGSVVWADVATSLRRDKTSAPLYLMTSVSDITERKRAEERITTLNRLLRTISEVNQLIVRERDRDRLLAEACRIMVEHGGFRMAWVGFTDDATGTVVPAAWAGFEDGYLGAITARFDDTPLGRGPTGIAIREGRVVVADDWETDERLAPWREAARARGYRSSASFPLSAGGKVTGALTVYAAEAAGFDTEVTNLLGELAGDIAFALEAMNADTRREAAERSLAGSEERFRIASETSNDLVYEWDLKQGIQWFGNIDEMLGYGTGEFPRTLDGWAASVHPDDLEHVMASVRAHLEKQVPYALEYRVRTHDGAYRWWTARGAAARKADGKPVRWVGTITDITERKRDEEALRESEARYRTLVENIPQKIFMKDRNFRFVSINEKFAHDLGIRPEEAVGKADADFFPPELAAKYHEDDVRILETGKTEVLEERYLPEGREAWVSTIKTPVRDANGEIVGVLGVFWDITECKRAAETLRESEERFRNLFNSAVEGVYQTTPGGLLIAANMAFARMFGYKSPEEAINTVMDIAHELYANSDDRKRVVGIFMEMGFIKDFECQMRRKDGSIFWTTFNGRLSKTPNGTPCFEGFIIDITERKRAEEALEQQAAELKARNEELMRFNDAAVGRELRMVELKRQVNELCGQLGKPAMYPLGFLDGGSEAPIAAPVANGQEPAGKE